jgi:hypothetical protein
LQFPFTKFGLFMPQKGVPYFLFDIDLGGKKPNGEVKKL